MEHFPQISFSDFHPSVYTPLCGTKNVYTRYTTIDWLHLTMLRLCTSVVVRRSATVVPLIPYIIIQGSSTLVPGRKPLRLPSSKTNQSTLFSFNQLSPYTSIRLAIVLDSHLRLMLLTLGIRAAMKALPRSRPCKRKPVAKFVDTARKIISSRSAAFAPNWQFFSPAASSLVEECHQFCDGRKLTQKQLESWPSLGLTQRAS